MDDFVTPLPAPGMTDLMVTPESIDEFLAKYPPPPEGGQLPWPHSHADHPLLATDGVPLSPGDSFDTSNLFVRCHDCIGGRSDSDCSCGGTGFDWTDTVAARRTVEAAIEKTS